MGPIFPIEFPRRFGWRKERDFGKIPIDKGRDFLPTWSDVENCRGEIG